MPFQIRKQWLCTGALVILFMSTVFMGGIFMFLATHNVLQVCGAMGSDVRTEDSLWINKNVAWMGCGIMEIGMTFVNFVQSVFFMSLQLVLSTFFILLGFAFDVIATLLELAFDVIAVPLELAVKTMDGLTHVITSVMVINSIKPVHIRT